jgi:PhnB protein
MDTLKIPAGYQTVMPYLIIKNAGGFLSFTQKVFNAKEKHKTMRTDTLIMHGEIEIGASTIMFADSTDDFKPCPAGLFIYVANADETYKIAIEAGATSIMEPANQSYGRSCGVKDIFGNTWWITTAD